MMRTLCFSMILLLFPWAGADTSGSKWELRKNEAGIKIYTRAVEGSALDEFKAHAEFAFPMEKIVAILEDADHFKDWMPNCSHSKLIKREGPKQYHYTITSAPFPLDDRDCYYRFSYERTADQVKISMDGLPDYGPKKEDMVRIPSVKGYWLFEKLGPQKTKITYQVLANPGGSIPGWLANAGSVDSPFNTLKNLRKRLK
ncbi:START domain-containing protein [Croceimicrobium sp.]|uniref:START domain-containing protein n=1 Tax=Croceimicrobium sp. TaxID=2828340 RepID=UPI003BABB64D